MLAAPTAQPDRAAELRVRQLLAMAEVLEARAATLEDASDDMRVKTPSFVKAGRYRSEKSATASRAIPATLLLK
jgi:hypothetical protein